MRRGRPRLHHSVRDGQLKWNYGITEQEYNAKLLQQEGKCAICNCTVAEAPKQRLAVDHNHRTEMVRGLLCINCNAGVGLFKESIQLLKSAVDYLTHYEGAEEQPAALPTAKETFKADRIMRKLNRVPSPAAHEAFAKEMLAVQKALKGEQNED